MELCLSCTNPSIYNTQDHHVRSKTLIMDNFFLIWYMVYHRRTSFIRVLFAGRGRPYSHQLRFLFATGSMDHYHIIGNANDGANLSFNSLDPNMVAHILVNTGWGNDLLPDGTKPLPQPMLIYHQWSPVVFTCGSSKYQLEYVVKITYRQVFNISLTLVGNKIVDRSGVVGASPVSTAPTTSSFST